MPPTKINQVTESIRQQIRDGSLTGRIPGERALAQRYNVNVKTANRAVTQLVRQGLLHRVRGRGTFVSETDQADTADMMVALIMRSEGHIYEPMLNTLLFELQQRHFIPLLLGDQMGAAQVNRIIGLNPAAVIVDGSLVDATKGLLEIHDNIRHLIIVDRPPNAIPDNVDVVYPDMGHGTYIMTKHLHSLGHRKIVFSLPYPKDAPTRREMRGPHGQFDGYIRAIEELQLAPHLHEYSPDKGASRNALHRSFETLSPPTAILTTQDSRALEMIDELGNIGLSVPEDVAVTGYFNTPWSTHSAVPLTSISIREQTMAEMAATFVASGKCRGERICLEPELIVRQSCGAANG